MCKRCVTVTLAMLAGLLVIRTAGAADLLDVLKEAEAFNPRLKGARFEERAAAARIDVERSHYYPSINAALIASGGQPGSFSLLDVDGEISSTQRIGSGGAFVIKQELWDFGRTSNAVHGAEEQQEVRRRELPVLRTDVDLTVLKAYIDCSFQKVRREDTQFMSEQTRLLAKETERFVRSGQRSIIERFLVDAEYKELGTRLAEFNERIAASEQRLAIEMGRPPTVKVECSDFAAVEKALRSLESRVKSSPVVDMEEARVRVAEAQVGQSKAESRPTLIGMATGGFFDNDHLKDKWIYAAGVGLKVPLFEGFRIDSGIQQAEASLQAEKENLAGARLGLARANSNFEAQIQALKVRLNFLDEERVLAKNVFALAKRRYLAFQGTMVDLRESIHNLNRIFQATDEANRDLLQTRGEQALVNGASD